MILHSFKAFLKRKDIVLSGKRYGIDALGAMAQGLFCTLLVGRRGPGHGAQSIDAVALAGEDDVLPL